MIDSGESPPRVPLYCYHYTSPEGDDDGGVSRARSAARAARNSSSIAEVSGCNLPEKTRKLLEGARLVLKKEPGLPRFSLVERAA